MERIITEFKQPGGYEDGENIVGMGEIRLPCHSVNLRCAAQVKIYNFNTAFSKVERGRKKYDSQTDELTVIVSQSSVKVGGSTAG